MNTTRDYLSALKAHYSIETDYALAKELACAVDLPKRTAQRVSACALALSCLIFLKPVHAGEWWTDDGLTNGLMITANTFLIADWAQTRRIADDPHLLEINPMLGQYPTTAQVNRHFVGSLIFTNVVGSLLPSKYKSTYYRIAATWELAFVAHNIKLGINVSF